VVISGFDWDDDNIFHIERHDFTPEEVEEVFAGVKSSMSPWAKPLMDGWLL
jgi:hypothetical protein